MWLGMALLLILSLFKILIFVLFVIDFFAISLIDKNIPLSIFLLFYLFIFVCVGSSLPHAGFL